MPNIRTYQAPELEIRPSSLGVDATAAAARRIGAFYNQAGDAMAQTGQRVASTVRDVGDIAVKYAEHQEISSGAANFAQMQDGLTKLWNETAKNADPNDPTVAAKFRENVLEPTLEKYTSAFNTEGGQKFAEQHIEALRNHMFAKTAADMSSMAGIAVRVNAEKTVNSLASSVASDPSGLDFALKTVDSTLGGVVKSSPNLSPETAASVQSEVSLKAKEMIVKSAVSGMIQKNPNIDLDAIQKKYPEFINGAEMKMFQKAAQTQAKVDLLQQKQIETYQRQKEEHAANDAMTKVMTDNMAADSNGRMTIKPEALQQALDIARKYPQAGAAPARAMIDFIQAQQNKDLKAVDNPAVVTDLSTRLFDPDKPTSAIDLMRARTKGDISDHTYTQLNGMVKELEETPLRGPVYQDTMKAAHSTLVLTGVGIPGKDDVGEKNYAKFVQSFIPQYIAKSRSGTLEPNALDVKDPNSMISKAMEPFRRTLTERINDYTSALGGGKSEAAAPPRISSKAEYDKLDVGTVYISSKDGQRYEKR